MHSHNKYFGQPAKAQFLDADIITVYFTLESLMVQEDFTHLG